MQLPSVIITPIAKHAALTKKEEPTENTALNIEKANIKKKNIMAVISGAAFMTVVNVNSVLAASDASSVTKPLDNLKTLVLAIIGAIGVIILAKNVMEFAQAYQAADSSTMNSALKGIVAGVMMAGISSVLGILGF